MTTAGSPTTQQPSAAAHSPDEDPATAADFHAEDAGWDAIVLAGGAARRLGGAHKPGLEVGGASLLARVAEACAHGGGIVGVGPPRPLDRSVLWTREQP